MHPPQNSDCFQKSLIKSNLYFFFVICFQIEKYLWQQNKKQIYIPKGFGHLCISTMDNTEVQYKVDEFWEPSYERAITYADKTINLKLPDLQIIVSEKDKNADTLDTCDINFIYGENC